MNKVRKRGKIAKKAKWKISNTADDPIDLVSSDDEEEEEKNFEDSDSDTSMISLIRRDKGKKVFDGSKKRKWKAREKGESSKKRKKYKHANDEKQVLEWPCIKKKRNNWLGISTRTSPCQFFRCISVLKEKQRAAVKQMGFGKLLRFKVDGIPSKLAHFVVDNFRPRKLEIRVPCGKIKIDSEVIHRLLGIPRGGVSLSSLTKLEAKDEGVKKWRSRYAGRFVAPTKIVDNIERSKDEDSFDFRMDFLMCFLTVMVDCHKQGRLRERILDYLTEETNFSELDWCGYVVEKLRRCKDGWTRCDKGSPFVGPLTVLALLYVDNVECKGMEVDHTVNPITFWNMEKLRVRENLEIRNGGFGMGTFNRLSSCTVNPTQKDTTLLSVDRLLEKIPDVTMKNKKKTENALGKLYQEYPDEKPRWPIKLTEEISMADDEFKSVLKGKHVERGEGSGNEESQDELHDGAEKLYDAATEFSGKPTDEAAFPGSNETVTTANFIFELNQFGKGNARGCGGEEEVNVDEARVVEGRKEGGKTEATEKTTEAGINAANDMMDKVLTQMGDLSGLTLDERLIAMSVIGRSAPLAKMFDGLDVGGKFRMAQMVANGTIR